MGIIVKHQNKLRAFQFSDLVIGKTIILHQI